MTSQDTHSVWSRMNGPHSQSVSHLAPNAIQRATLHSARWPPRSCRAGDPRRHCAESDDCYAGPPGLPDGPRVRPRRVGAGAFFDPASALIGVPMGDARLPSVGDSPGINAAENHRSSQSSESPRRFASRRAGPIAGSAGHGATHPLGWRLPAPSSSPGIAESAPGRTPASPLRITILQAVDHAVDVGRITPRQFVRPGGPITPFRAPVGANVVDESSDISIDHTGS